jgi:site-specific DNA-methyltransferase (adenine-specific)
MKATWQSDCGTIRLFHADCREVLASMADESVDVFWTDPPYGHGNMDGDLQAARVRDGVKGARVREAEPIANDVGQDFERLMAEFLDQAARLMKHDCCCCCCCCMAGGGPTPTFAKVSQMIDQRLEFFQALVWDKSARGNGMGWRYRRNYEFIMVAHRKGGRLLWADDAAAVPNVLRHMPVRDRKHPNEKPLSLVMDMLRWHSAEGDTVCDPFAGSGTTIEACVRLGRSCIAVESDPVHFATCVRRAEDALEAGRLFEPAPPPEQRSMFSEEPT